VDALERRASNTPIFRLRHARRLGRKSLEMICGEQSTASSQQD
jgi:hypothetical protein